MYNKYILHQINQSLSLIMQSSDISITTATTRTHSLQHFSTMSTDPSTSSILTPLPNIHRILISSNQPPLVVLSPCAACKILRRRCADTCMLAPYFPPTNPIKFTTAHRVFGASNIIKLLHVNHPQFLFWK
jgi:Lateral organ boundaries (LOB) domain